MNIAMPAGITVSRVSFVPSQVVTSIVVPFADLCGGNFPCNMDRVLTGVPFQVRNQ